MSDERDYAVGSGNVFADLGLPDADTRLAKAEMARQISAIIRDRGWTQEEAAQALGIDQPKVSALVRGRLSGFSTDRLMEWLTRLDQDVTITVTPKEPSHRRATIAVHAGALPMAAAGRNGDDRKMIC